MVSMAPPSSASEKAGPTISPDGGILVRRAAERDLVKLRALLIDAENADVADMVMAAGIDAAGDFDLEFADVLRLRLIAKALGYILRDRDRARVREVAIVEAGASR